MTLIAAIAFGVITIAIVCVYAWMQHKAKTPVIDLKIISAGRLHQRTVKVFLDTARSEDKYESYYINRYAVRRHYKTGKLAQLCVDYSAIPLCVGVDQTTVAWVRDYCIKRKPVLGENAFHTRLGNNQREAEQETTRQTLRIVVIGTVIIVMVICTVVLLTSEKVNLF